MRTILIPEGAPGMSLRRFLLRAFPNLKDWQAKGLIKDKKIRLNGARANPGDSVKPGDEVSVYESDGFLLGPTRVLYRDDDLIVLEKPSGIPVDVDNSGIGEDTMLSRLKAIDPSARLCHRLDTGTGGVLIAARSDRAYERVTRLFHDHEMVKKYRCVVFASPARDGGRLNDWLIKGAREGVVRVVSSQQPAAVSAKLDWSVVSRRDDLTLLEINLYTGRTHQIRVQLSHARMPVLGDDKYGDRAANRRYGTAHPLLWCTEISFDQYDFISPHQFAVMDKV